MVTLERMAWWGCVGAYNPTGVFTQVLQVGDITVCLISLPGKTIVIFPGSKSLRDWYAHDLVAIPFEHPKLGTLHYGFWNGMEAVFATIQPLLKGDVYVGGHSLGAARSALFAALLGLNGVKTRYMALFESPRPGMYPLRTFLLEWVTGYFSAVNGPDPVPLVPPSPFMPPVPSFAIDSLPETGGGFEAWLEDEIITNYHAGALVYKGVSALPYASQEI